MHNNYFGGPHDSTTANDSWCSGARVFWGAVILRDRPAARRNYTNCGSNNNEDFLVCERKDGTFHNPPRDFLQNAQQKRDLVSLRGLRNRV